ncbi:RCC1-like G exchanging factor-like protein isoform X1 [Neodiprion virginianus]|uniref:RCC1-like G exchanging factor-like protein isoform X1 n=1 Tax=Neodiprion virginianus TaxID=2961670 RepID=UPI001EE7175C|nr:RCC1-like G exchanging factor-like protein isoform X1 [Neodiprion virginianus]
MFKLVRNYSKLSSPKVRQKLTATKTKSPNPPPNELPVFQYPVSQSSDRRVYVWGLAGHGALGLQPPIAKRKKFLFYHKPNRLRFAEQHRVIDIESGYGFTVFAVDSKDGNILWGNGINTDSQLGYDEAAKDPQNVVPLPKPIHLPLKNPSSQVTGLAAGRAHLLVLTTEGLFTLGNNGYGQCGRPIIVDEDYTNNTIVHHIPDIKGERIKSVTAGQDHSILLSESGQVYTFGWGADGQTGLAHYRNEYKPSLVKGDLAGENIVKVACMADCVLALSDKGTVFGWGNSEYGQLPSLVDNHQINIATEIQECRSLGHVVDIAAGGSFCMVLNSDGNVFVWGYGILGVGPAVQRAKEPTMIPATLFGFNAYSRNNRVSQIYCGISQLAAVTDNGDLYMWGCNKFGSLGLGNIEDQFFPLKVAVGAQVKKVSCGVDHTVTLCKPYI